MWPSSYQRRRQRRQISDFLDIEMRKKPLSANTSITLQNVMHALQALERRWRKTGSKRALVRYLAAVFDLYSGWKRAGVLPMAVARIAKLAALHDRTGRHPMRLIIEATSKADRRSKSRWTQALRYAWRERVRWPTLLRCLEANGGIAGCASKWADLQAEGRTPPGYVRVGGEAFPRVPLFVGGANR
jgi:hypothetical protein